MLRQWNKNEYLPFGIHDIWGHETGSAAWQLQIMLAEVEGDQWFSRRNPRIRGKREDLISVYNGVPSIRIEVQLMYKSRGQRPKDDLDFHTCLPLMSIESKQWLREALLLLYPEGHNWLGSLP